MFSDYWIHSFLKRKDFSRSRITSEGGKTMWKQSRIQAHMKIGADLYNEHDLKPEHVWNYDENGLNWAVGPTYIYMPKKMKSRAKSGSGETVKGIITQVVTVNGVGDFASNYFIIRYAYWSLHFGINLS